MNKTTTHSRQCYVVNPMPAFCRPEHHKHTLPAFNRRLLGMLGKRDISRWEGFYFYDAFHHRGRFRKRKKSYAKRASMLEPSDTA